MTINVFELTEQELSVDVNNVKEFTQENVDTLDALRSKAAHPRIYGSKAPKGINYLTTELICHTIIDSDNMGFNQGARVTANDAIDSIREDIISNGYSLTELPICVMKLGDRYIILEGRTRYHILRALGVKNIIADIFEQTTSANALRFAVAQNAQKKPFGKASFDDVNKAILELIKMGEIDIKAPNFPDLVSQEIMRITTKLEPQQINRIIHNANDVIQAERTVISFPGGDGAVEWLKDNGYTGNREIMYWPVSTYDIKAILSGCRQAMKYPDIKEIRLIVHGSVLDAKDPAKAWLNGPKKFKTAFDTMLKNISTTYFGSMPVRMSRVKLYGAIPQVKALEDKYPMDEIVLFD